ncbi:hypothetical protein ACFLZ0_01855 [Patescibacteria group bacterium]
MAAPITHIVLTDKIFNQYFKNKIKKDFFIGVCLPDIRYLKVIERSKTHFNNLTLDDIKKEKNSFLAGLKFHSLTDMVRERFINSKNIYSLFPESEYITESLKLLEDNVLYNKINNWNEFINFLKEILKDELSFGISEKDIKKWHKTLQGYFSQYPDNNIREILLIDLGFSKDIAKKLNFNIEKMEKNKKIIQIIYELYDDFDSLLFDTNLLS